MLLNGILDKKETVVSKIHDVCVVGLGACGMTASLYCVRGGYSVIGVEKLLLGGQLFEIESLENFPSFSGKGSELANRMEEQLTQYENFTLMYDEVTRVRKSFNGDYYEVELMLEEPILARGVIIANGTKPRELPILKGFDNVHYCALCDGSLYSNANLVVLGGGNSAYSEALYLRGLGNDVTVAYRGTNPRAEKCLMDRAFRKGIRTVLNFDTTDVIGEKPMLELLVSGESMLSCDGVFVAVGRETEDSFYNGLRIDDRVVVANDGDQVVTACAKGAEAGIRMMRILG